MSGLIRMLFSLVNNPQVIEKLADSRPIRRAAQITAFAITKAQIAGKDTLRQARQEATGTIPRDVGEIGNRIKRVGETFVKEVKEGLKDGSRQLKK